MGKSHEDDKRFGGADFRPVDLAAVVSGDEGDDGSVVAVRERDAGISRDAERRRHAGDDLEINAGIGESFGLFATASEKEWIAAFQPHHVESAPAAINQKSADFVLGERVVGFFLADVDAFGSGRGKGQKIGWR